MLTLEWSLISKGGFSQVSQALIQEVIDGNQVYIGDTQARVQDKANFGQMVLTKNSRAGLLFNNGAAGRLGQNTSIIVGQCIEVEQGELLVSGSVNGCMANVTVSVTGTLYVMEKNNDEAGSIKVIEGTVQISDRNQPGQLIRVREGEQIRLRKGILSSVLSMSPEEIFSLLNGQLFSKFQVFIASKENLQKICTRLLPNMDCSPTGRPSKRKFRPRLLR